MDGIEPMEFSASGGEYWVNGIHCYGVVHAILNGHTGTGSYSQPSVYDRMDQGKPHSSPPFVCSHTISQTNINEKPTPPDGWSACAKTVQKHDENAVRSWAEEIDTLLVFVRAADDYVPDVKLTGK